MKRPTVSVFAALPLLLSLAGCDPSPDEACDGYIAYRKRESLPAGDDIRDKCLAAVQWVKEEAQGDAYQCVSNGLARGKEGGEEAHVETVVYGCSRQYGEIDDDLVHAKWQQGIAGDYDMQSAKVRRPPSPDDEPSFVPMTPRECEDVALWALEKKIEAGEIDSESEGRSYADSMLSDCQAIMSTPDSGKFRCARLATSTTAIEACLG